MTDTGCTGDLEFGNSLLWVSFHTESATFTVVDRRTSAIYEQVPLPGLPTVLQAERTDGGTGLRAELSASGAQQRIELRLRVADEAAELRCELSASGPMSAELAYPAPFRGGSGAFLAIPMNEGVFYPVTDTVVPAARLLCYAGHSLSMPWFGLSQGEQGSGVLAIIETPDDAAVDLARPTAAEGAVLCAWPVWEPSRGELRYPRVVTYAFFESGGYVAQAKRYRRYAQQTGLYRPLREKLEENPNVDLLVGAPSFWAPGWDGPIDPIPPIKEMLAAGVERIMCSSGGTPDRVKALNEMGVLTSRYDNYADVWPADADVPWRKKGWPEHLVLLPDGSPVRWWPKDPDDPDSRGGLICSQMALGYARKEIPADLARTPYRSRFIDTVTATPWRECYHPDHPLTRSDDRRHRMALLRYCSEELKLVTSSEDGLDAAVPYVHYFEGMISLKRFLLPNCGFHMLEHQAPTAEFLRFQVGPYYRVPLWELVYHDCVVSYWWWGDGQSKSPEVWDQRDLIDVLYGVPPLFMLGVGTWEAHRERFLKSAREVGGSARKVGYDEMLSHQFLTGDHTLQQTTWSSGLSLIANFADYPQTLPDGTVVPAKGWLER